MLYRRACLAALVVILAACTPKKTPQTPPPAPAPTTDAPERTGGPTPAYRGTNLNGADFGSALPGTEGRDYVWPTAADVDYFMARGMNAFRIGFRWERLQPTAKGELAAAYAAKLDALVKYATGKGALVLLNPQNFARYYGKVVGTADVPSAVFADFWRRVAERYKGNPRVAFGLVNEPNTMQTEQWLDAANAAIKAIRATGATNLITVPGNAWTGASHWSSTWYGTANAVAMLKVEDPIDHIAFETHNYFDADASGGGTDCAGARIGSERMANVVAWARAHKKKLWIGELGTPNTTTCAAAVKDFLSYAQSNADVVMGWTWWSGGPWWKNTKYPLSISPFADGGERPQLAWLKGYLPAVTPAPAPTPPPPPDRDGDGIPDAKDACPDTKGIASDDPKTNGCPPPRPPELLVSMGVRNDWTSGYCTDLSLTNKTNAPISWATVTVDLKDGKLRAPGHVWGGQGTGKLTFVPAAETSPVKAGATVKLGFCADRGPSKALASIEGVTY